MIRIWLFLNLLFPKKTFILFNWFSSSVPRWCLLSPVGPDPEHEQHQPAQQPHHQPEPQHTAQDRLEAGGEINKDVNETPPIPKIVGVSHKISFNALISTLASKFSSQTVLNHEASFTLRGLLSWACSSTASVSHRDIETMHISNLVQTDRLNQNPIDIE